MKVKKSGVSQKIRNDIDVINEGQRAIEKAAKVSADFVDKQIYDALTKDPNKVKMGKKSRKSGKAFEIKVRHDLEEKGWIVDRWTNNVGYEDCDMNMYGPSIIDEGKRGKLIPAKAKYNPFTKSMMMMSGGFPDFICFQDVGLGDAHNHLKGVLADGSEYQMYAIIGVECKINGYLTKEEKEKCDWLLKNHIFSKILIASKGEKRGSICYTEFVQTARNSNP